MVLGQAACLGKGGLHLGGKSSFWEGVSPVLGRSCWTFVTPRLNRTKWTKKTHLVLPRELREAPGV